MTSTLPRMRLAIALSATTMLTPPALAQTLPTGGQVVSGQATISQSGNAMTINQSSDRMIANWQSFSIGAGNSVTFNQPGASSVALNRVVGQDPSKIRQPQRQWTSVPDQSERHRHRQDRQRADRRLRRLHARHQQR